VVFEDSLAARWIPCICTVMLKDYLPVLLQIVVACGFAVSTLVASVLLGKSGTPNAIKDSAYECGMLPIGDGQPRFSVKFYMVAMLFVLFDIEVVFMYPWALVFRDLVAQSTAVFWSMAGFAGILFIAYLYALKKGALRWND
jgi:NADH-quinone oxidoreductase subunit A